MPVPFGFGISDFVAVGQLALRIYKSCEILMRDFISLLIIVQAKQLPTYSQLSAVKFNHFIVCFKRRQRPKYRIRFLPQDKQG